MHTATGSRRGPALCTPAAGKEPYEIHYVHLTAQYSYSSCVSTWPSGSLPVMECALFRSFAWSRVCSTVPASRALASDLAPSRTRQRPNGCSSSHIECNASACCLRTDSELHLFDFALELLHRLLHLNERCRVCHRAATVVHLQPTLQRSRNVGFTKRM
jgi:hypothetical protein